MNGFLTTTHRASDLLVLWDIDGTLTRGGRAAVEAFNRALSAVYSLATEVSRISTTGKTDAQIALETLALHGLEEAEVFERLPIFREAYAAELGRVRHRVSDDLVVLPGVPEVLERLRELGARQTLLTGNFEASARIKVAVAGLDQYFDFSIGAYGSDHHDRNCLVPIALERASRAYPPGVPAERAVVVGDSPRDIACARAGGVRVVAVASGRPTYGELESHHPDALLPNLEDAPAAVEVILGKPA